MTKNYKSEFQFTKILRFQICMIILFITEYFQKKILLQNYNSGCRNGIWILKILEIEICKFYSLWAKLWMDFWQQHAVSTDEGSFDTRTFIGICYYSV